MNRLKTVYVSLFMVTLFYPTSPYGSFFDYLSLSYTVVSFPIRCYTGFISLSCWSHFAKKKPRHKMLKQANQVAISGLEKTIRTLQDTQATQHEKQLEHLKALQKTLKAQKKGLIEYQKERIAYYAKQQEEYASLIKTVDGINTDAKNFTATLASQLYTIQEQVQTHVNNQQHFITTFEQQRQNTEDCTIDFKKMIEETMKRVEVVKTSITEQNSAWSTQIHQTEINTDRLKQYIQTNTLTHQQRPKIVSKASQTSYITSALQYVTAPIFGAS